MKLSVIIPTLNRASRLAMLLDSFVQMDKVPWDWEVIIIDNGSSDNTEEIVSQKMNVLPINIRYFKELKPGLHQGRHRGAKESEAEIIAYLDDDMKVASSWIHGTEMLQKTKADAVVGRILPLWESPPPAWIISMMNKGTLGTLGLIDLGERPVPTEHFFGGNLFIKRKTIFSLKGFHPDGMPQNLIHYRGDGETGLWKKMQMNNMSVWYAPSAIAYHIIPKERLTIDYFCKRSFNQGISDSYTDMRTSHGLYSNSQNIQQSILVKLKKWIIQTHMLTLTKYYLQYVKATSEADRKNAHIKLQIYKSYMKGWYFHRNVMRQYPELTSYVLRESYIE